MIFPRTIVLLVLPFMICAATAPVPIRTTEVEAIPADFPKPAPHEISAARLVEESLSATDYEAAKAMLLRAAAMVPEPSQIRGGIICLLASKLMENAQSKNGPLGLELMERSDECYRLLPDNAYAQAMAGLVKVETDQARLGGRLLLAAIKSEPILLRSMPVASMKRTLRLIGYAGENDLIDELRLGLVTAGFAKDEPAEFSGMAYDAMLAHIQARKPELAVALLPQILDVDTGLALMADRRLQMIWPAIDEWSAGTFEKQRDASVAAAMALFRADPSIENRKRYGDSLASAGKMEEAIKLLQAAIDDPTTWDEERFDIVMLTVRYGYYLSSTGRAAQAFAVARKMSRAIPVADYSSASNLMPNLAQMLISDGRHQDALDLIELEYPKRDDLESDAAFGFYAALRFCAYTGLKRASEAKSQSALIDNVFSENAAARKIRDSCVTSLTKLRANWSSRMLDTDDRREAILEHQRAHFGIATVTGSIQKLQTERYDFLRTDPEIQRQYNLFARDLPQSFIPALNKWSGAKASK